MFTTLHLSSALIEADQLSFTTGDTAWQDIYGRRQGGGELTGKDPYWYPPVPIKKAASLTILQVGCLSFTLIDIF